MVTDCLTRCAVEYAACTSTCGDGFGIAGRACRRAILRRCRDRGVSAACASDCSTSRTIEGDAAPTLRLRAAANPCAALVDLTATQPRGTVDAYCTLTVVQGGRVAEGIRCRPGERIHDVFANAFFCYQTPDFRGCFVPGSDGVSAILRDFPPWLDLTDAFAIGVDSHHLDVPAAVR